MTLFKLKERLEAMPKVCLILFPILIIFTGIVFVISTGLYIPVEGMHIKWTRNYV